MDVINHWRKSSQWFALLRKHALLIVDDVDFEGKFKKYCRSAFDEDYNKWVKILPIAKQYQAHVCIPCRDSMIWLLGFTAWQYNYIINYIILKGLFYQTRLMEAPLMLSTCAGGGIAIQVSPIQGRETIPITDH